jgi:hypothetical protein
MAEKSIFKVTEACKACSNTTCVFMETPCLVPERLMTAAIEFKAENPSVSLEIVDIKIGKDPQVVWRAKSGLGECAREAFTNNNSQLLRQN